MTAPQSRPEIRTIQPKPENNKDSHTNNTKASSNLLANRPAGQMCHLSPFFIADYFKQSEKRSFSKHYPIKSWNDIDGY